MKNILFLLTFICFIGGCDTTENDNSLIRPFASGTPKIEINFRQVIVTTGYGTPTPCWYYFRNETTKNDTVYTSKVYGKDDGNPCVQVLGSFSHEERILFQTGGEKHLSFWQNDSTWLDTTIFLPLIK